MAFARASTPFQDVGSTFVGSSKVYGLNSSPAMGQLLVLCTASNTSVTTTGLGITSITDSRSNSWSVASHIANSIGMYSSIWFTVLTSALIAGTDQVTINMGQASNKVVLICGAFTGGAATGILDQTGTASSTTVVTGTSPFQYPVSTAGATAAGELVIGNWSHTAPWNTIADAGYTSDTNPATSTGTTAQGSEYNLSGPGGIITLNYPETNADEYTANIATFKLPAPAGLPPHSRRYRYRPPVRNAGRF